MRTTSEAVWYEIQVEGVLGEGWDAWLEGRLEISHAADARTTIVTHVPDQAALRGVLNRLWDLNLVVLFVQQLHESPGS